MSYYEGYKEDMNIAWKEIGIFLLLIGFMFSSGVLLHQVREQRQKIIQLELDKKEVQIRLEYLYGAIKELQYETDILTESIKK